MCYSIMVETDLRRLAADHGASIDWEHLMALLERRAEGDRSVVIPRALGRTFDHAPGDLPPRERELAEECRRLWERGNAQAVGRLTVKAAEYNGKIIALRAKLAKKSTKTALGALEAAERGLAKATRDLAHLQGPLKGRDGIVFQYSQAPLLVRDDRGRTLVRLHRYQVRPRWAGEEPNRKLNLFNARLDKLEERRTWAPLFMARHGAVIVERFFEWVEHPATGRLAVVNFYAPGHRPIWVPALHEHWQGEGGDARPIDSFAILTTEPPPEVQAMGHDRCPVHPRGAFLAEWLNPRSCTREHLLRGLTDQEPLVFAHSWGRRGEDEAGGGQDEAEGDQEPA